MHNKTGERVAEHMIGPIRNARHAQLGAIRHGYRRHHRLLYRKPHGKYHAARDEDKNAKKQQNSGEQRLPGSTFGHVGSVSGGTGNVKTGKGAQSLFTIERARITILATC